MADSTGGSDFGGTGIASNTGGTNNNSLIAALAGDATTIGTTYIATNAATNALKANPNAIMDLIYVAGGIAALVVIVFALKKK